MSFDPSKHHRRSIRLKEYDYSWSGWYYVTICTHNRECTLGKIVDDLMVHSSVAKLVQACWESIPKQFPSIELDDVVIMPNHMHGIIILNQPRRGEVASPRLDNKTSPSLGDETSPLRELTLGKVIAHFKYQSTKKVNEEKETPGMKIWQRNYYEHIIRNDADLHRIRTYIQNNPLQWAIDEENPVNDK
jgi:REP element-mobilizing transposase RayT